MIRVFLPQANIEAQQILVLLDVDFILAVQAYVESIYHNILNLEKNELLHSALQSLKNTGQQHGKVKFELGGKTETVENKGRFKLQAIVRKFAVALLDPEHHSVEQVVMLQVCVHRVL